MRAALLAILLAACFAPHYDDPTCGPGSACPDGYTCGADNVCHASSAIDANVIDARVIDATPIDAVPLDATPVCGNGIPEFGEACDDGNTVDGPCAGGSPPTACGMTCGAGCPNGFFCSADGLCNGGDGCSANCLSNQTCGNGVRDPGEVCDDGNTVDGPCFVASPPAECAIACDASNPCPDGFRCGGDGMCDGIDGCSHDCSSASGCGDGTIEPGEQCDDGNFSSLDGCSGQCRIEAGYQCGGTPSVCISTCGDGTRAVGAEACDDGNTVTETSCSYGTPSCTACSADCQSVLPLNGPFCGDGAISNGEVCDDGNSSTCGGCSALCDVQIVPLAATGMIQPVGSSALSDGETFTLNDGIHAPLIFEFDRIGDGVAAGHILVDATGSATATGMATRIATPINTAHTGGGLDITASAAGHVTLTHQFQTSLGNHPISETVGDPSFLASGMSGGADGDCASGTGCKVASDCAPGLACTGIPRTCQ